MKTKYEDVIVWLDELTIEEIKSLLKSNVMDWDLRKKIRGMLKAKVLRKAIIELTPVVCALICVSSIKSIVDEMTDKM